VAVTRCQENTGFLVLHRCEKPAEFDCVYCGRRICAEHGKPVDAQSVSANAASQTTPPPVAPPAGNAVAPPPPPPGALQSYACLTCLKNRQQQAGQQGITRGYDDPFYHYPYYGSYRPYHTGYYYDYSDRGVFDRERADASDRTDALGS